MKTSPNCPGNARHLCSLSQPVGDRFKWELEDLAFKYLEPEAYRQMQDLVAEKRADREARLANVTETLKAGLEQADCTSTSVDARSTFMEFTRRCSGKRNFMKFTILPPSASLLRPMRNAIVLWQLFTMPFDRFQAGLGLHWPS